MPPSRAETAGVMAVPRGRDAATSCPATSSAAPPGGHKLLAAQCRAEVRCNEKAARGMVLVEAPFRAASAEEDLPG
jgi:hypothetical protein